MSHKNKVSLYMQVNNALEDKFTPGRSKHADKAAGETADRIYSYSTLESYKKHSRLFVAYCKTNYGCKTLAECVPYIRTWLEDLQNMSAYTVKLKAAALSKLYGIPTTDRDFFLLLRLVNAATSDGAEAQPQETGIFQRKTTRI